MYPKQHRFNIQIAKFINFVPTMYWTMQLLKLLASKREISPCSQGVFSLKRQWKSEDHLLMS